MTCLAQNKCGCSLVPQTASACMYSVSETGVSHAGSVSNASEYVTFTEILSLQAGHVMFRTVQD